MSYENRTDAGKKLAEKVVLSDMDVSSVVVGIAKGGIVVAAEIAKSTFLPFMPLSIGKVDVGKEVRIGVSPFGDGCVFELPKKQNPPFEYVPRLSTLPEGLAHEMAETIRKQHCRMSNSGCVIKGKPVILCDDGIFHGYTLFTAIEAVRNIGASRITVAIPTILPWLASLAKEKDWDVVSCRTASSNKVRPGMVYEDFGDVSEQEVISVMGEVRQYQCP